MRSEIILRALPNPDPEFIKAMLGLPDPDFDMEKRILRALPKLHEIFLLKRQAAQAGNQEGFMSLIEKESAAIGEL